MATDSIGSADCDCENILLVMVSNETILYRDEKDY